MEKNQKKQWRRWFRSLGSYGVPLFIALTIRWGIAEAYVIPSGSMLPTLLIHDHIFVNKFVYGLRVPFSKSWLLKFQEPRRGEVIVFKDPRDNKTFLIKRIVGLPGDKIFYRDNQLYINDQLIESQPSGETSDFHWLRDQDVENNKSGHQYSIEKLGQHAHSVLHLQNNFDMDAGPIEVPPGSLFMMGDHRDNSSDSRFWGFAPMENILGRAMLVWLSCDEALPVVNFACDPTTMRWSRLLHTIN